MIASRSLAFGRQSALWLLLALAPLLSAAATERTSLTAIGAQAIAEDDFVYARADGLELRARSYRATTSGVAPAIIDVHGGAWSSGDRKQGAHYDRALASSGLFVLAIDFRQAPQFQHPTANRDIAAAVRFLRLNAERLRIDPSSIGLVGSSSGGHLAMLAGLTPAAPEFQGTQIAHGAQFVSSDVDASVRYVIALWPVSDPAYRYEYAQRIGRSELMRSHMSFFGSQDAMRKASVPRLLRANEAQQLPPLFVAQPGNDANIPREMTFDLLSAYQEAGGRLAYHFYPQQPHAFGHRPSADTDHLIVAMRDFISGVLRDPASR